MSGVLRLDQTARLFHGSAEMAEAWLGGVRVWAKPDPIEARYGVGTVGKIPLHYAPRLVPDGTISSWANRGGAGPYFDGSSTGNVKTGALMQMPPYIELANIAEAVGTRIFAVASTAINETRALFGGASGNITESTIELEKRSTTTYRINIRQRIDGVLTGWASANFTESLNNLALYEIETLPNRWRFWRNGTLISNITRTISSFPVACIGANSSRGQVFSGHMGDVLSLIADGSAASDSAAVEVRQRVASANGITLA